MKQIIELLLNKQIAFLENDDCLNDECQKVADLMVKEGISFHCIFDVEGQGFESVARQCRNVDVIIYQSTFVYPVSKELKKAFMSIQNPEFKKSFIEIYVNEPSFRRKPDGVIHDIYVLDNYEKEVEEWVFTKLN